jgi:hypothetical protein
VTTPKKETPAVNVDAMAQEWVTILLTTILAIQLDPEMGAAIIFTKGSPYQKVDPAFALAAITVCGMFSDIADIGDVEIRAMLMSVQTEGE